jgi:uncharacterized protein YgiM (DUF1202 family)
MSVQQKYSELVNAAKQAGVNNLQVREQNNVLYIDGTAPTGAVKDQLWAIYDKLDPNFKSGDVVLDVKVGDNGAGTKAKVITENSNLNLRKGPGTDQPIVGKAAHNATVTIINKTNEQWSLVRTDDGAEGYVYSQYLEKTV